MKKTRNDRSREEKEGVYREPEEKAPDTRYEGAMHRKTKAATAAAGETCNCRQLRFQACF